MTDLQKKNIEEVKSFSREVVDFLKDLIIIIAIVLVLRTFIAMPFQINGQSMYDSYYNKEFIIVDRLTYIIGEPNRGDVVVFKPGVSKDRQFFLKRIIGVSGDRIIIEEGKVYLKEAGAEDFVLLDEPYLSEANNGYTYIGGSKNKFEYEVPADSFFVLGDNRNHSTDSRECFSSCSYDGASNFIRSANITGRLLIDLGYFNFRSFGFIHPDLGIKTYPRLLNSPRNYNYESILSDR